MEPTPAAEDCTRIRVRYCECDPMGVAHHASYIPWFELARTELLRNRGTRYADLERDGVLLMVTRMDVRYKASVAYDDVVEIQTRTDHVGRARLRHAYELRVIESGSEAVERPIAAEASIELACCDATGRPRPLPDALRQHEG